MVRRMVGGVQENPGGGESLDLTALMKKHEELKRKLFEVHEKLENCDDRVRWLRLYEKLCAEKLLAVTSRRLVARLRHEEAATERELSIVIGQIGEIDPDTLEYLAYLEPTASSAQDAFWVARLLTVLERTDPAILVRDLTIMKYHRLTTRQICAKLEHELGESHRPAIGFPQSWQQKYGVHDYRAAYKDPRCRNNIQVLISRVKGAFRPLRSFTFS